MPTPRGLAIPLAWPDKTAYGDEKWMRWLKRFGIVKNLNFKVGHAAILLIDRQSGEVAYFDFGRYVAPRGYGRARSKVFDPRLELYTLAKFSDSGLLSNLEEILIELTAKEEYTHGGGKLLLSLAEHIDFKKASAYASALVEQGPIPYGALAAGNNSCSRYVAQTLVAGLEAGDPRRRRIYYPESLKASPTSNVVNATNEKVIYCYEHGKLEEWPMNRVSSLRFQWRLLQDNLSHKKSILLAKDDLPILLSEPKRPLELSTSAQWLGGIGEGMWFQLEQDDYNKAHYWMSAFNQLGTRIYRASVYCMDRAFDITKSFRISMKMSGAYFTVEQGQKTFVLHRLIEQEQQIY